MPDPQAFFQYALEAICREKDQIDLQIEETDTVIRCNARVADTDMKYVIGRKGKVINALRQCTRIMGSKSEKRIYFNLIES